MKAPTLLLLLVTTAVVVSKGRAQGDVVVFEPPTAEAVQKGKQAVDKWIAQAAAERGLVNVILGNTCFTTAISALNRECSQLSNEHRCWLAIQFTMCFQRVSGFKVMDCPSVCPKRRSLQSCVEECTGRMDSQQQTTYTHFFSDVLNMCLFLQTQNFQQVTAALVTDMHVSSAAANASLAHIRSDLQAQAHNLAQSLSALSKLQTVQSEVEAAVQAGLVEVKGLAVASQGLQRSMDQSLNMTSALTTRHDQLMAGFSELEVAHQAHAERAKESFEQLAQEAAALEHRQARYEALQTRLLNASESLLDQSQDMNELLRVLMHYQAKGNTILTQLQGSSISLHDVLFYTLALCIPLVFITYPSDVRMLLLAGVLACWGLERAVLQHYVMLFGALRNASKAAADGSVSVGAVGSWSGVQDVKVAVRMLVLGGTLAVVVWLLLKRRAANNRKDAIFQAIQHSLLQAQQQQAAAHHPHPPTVPAYVPVAAPGTQIIPAGRSSGRSAASKGAAAAAASGAAQLVATGPAALHCPPSSAAGHLAPQVLQSGMLTHSSAAGPGHNSLQLRLPSTPAPAHSSRGWLPPLFGSSQRNPAPTADIHPDVVSQILHHMGAAAHASNLQQHPQLLLQPSVPQLHMQASQLHSIQQQPHLPAAAAVQHHVVPSAQHATGQLEHATQQQFSQGESAMDTEGMEESIGTGAGAKCAPGSRQNKARGRTSAANLAAATAGGEAAAAKTAGKKRSAAAAAAADAAAGEGGQVEGAGDASVGGSEVTADAAAAKQGRPKRKK